MLHSPPSRAREVRALHLALNPLAHGHSSACVEIGSTRVLCLVRPPQQLVHEYRGDRGRVSCRLERSVRSSIDAVAGHAAPSTAHRPRSRRGLSRHSRHRTGQAMVSMSDAELKAMGLALEGVAEQLVMLDAVPQLLIEVVLVILRDDGGAVWDAASTAMAAALARGGFAMWDLCSACSAGVLCDGSLVCDLDASEQAEARVTVTVCVSLTRGGVVYMNCRGMCEPSTLTQLTQAAMRGVTCRRESLLTQMRAMALPPREAE